MNLARPEFSIADTLSCFDGLKDNETLELSADSRLTEITIAIEMENDPSSSLEFEYSDMRRPDGSVKECILLADLIKNNCATQCGTKLYVTFDFDSGSNSIDVRHNAQNYHKQLSAQRRYIGTCTK